MDEPRNLAFAPPSLGRLSGRLLSGGLLKDWQWLLILCAVVVPLRGWLLWNTEVAARDSIGYIRYALRFDEHSWGEVLRAFDQHPGYPLAIWLTSLPVRAVAGETTPELMVKCGQLVSALAAILLVWPMYYLGKALLGPAAAFGGALLFQCLPVTGHHLSDAVSESLFCLWIASALLFAVRGMAPLRPRLFVLAGGFAGLAYLTRPEGALAALAAGCALCLAQACRTTRRPWRVWSAAVAGLTVSAALVGSLLAVPIRGLSPKPSVDAVSDNVGDLFGLAPASAPAVALFAVAYQPGDGTPRRMLLSGDAVGRELLRGMHYAGLALVLVPVLSKRRRELFVHPGVWVTTSYSLLHAAALVALAMSVNYVSDRHVMPLVMLLSYLAALGVYQIAGWVCAAWRKTAPEPATGMKVGVAALVVLIAVSCLPRTLRRLHDNRAGHHAAGLWLAPRLLAGDMVDDDHAWSHYYAGQVFLEGKDLPAPPDYRPLCYVVMTRSRDPEVAGQRLGKERKLKRRGRLVYHWPLDRAIEEARVVVYAVPRDPRRHPWSVAAR
jgi:hypothetical protein